MELKHSAAVTVGGKQVILYGDPRAKSIFLQPVDEHDLEGMDGEIGALRAHCGHGDFGIAALRITDWNKELTPWESEPVFGKQRFGSGAAETLSCICTRLLPYLRKNFPAEGRRYFLCGYSLAGLFALWSAYQTDVFAGVAAASPSVWYPGWIEYAKERAALTQRIYLSLGDREERTKNPVMASVGDAIRSQYSLLTNAGVQCCLDWNPGNHFADSDLRVAKGMGWLLEATEEKHKDGASCD